MIRHEKIGPAKIGVDAVDLLPSGRGEPQVFGMTEEVAVLPKDFGRRTLAGVVAEAGADRALRAFDRLDIHQRRAGIGGI